MNNSRNIFSGQTSSGTTRMTSGTTSGQTSGTASTVNVKMNNGTIAIIVVVCIVVFIVLFGFIIGFVRNRVNKKIDDVLNRKISGGGLFKYSKFLIDRDFKGLYGWDYYKKSIKRFNSLDQEMKDRIENLKATIANHLKTWMGNELTIGTTGTTTTQTIRLHIEDLINEMLKNVYGAVKIYESERKYVNMYPLFMSGGDPADGPKTTKPGTTKPPGPTRRRAPPPGPTRRRAAPPPTTPAPPPAAPTSTPAPPTTRAEAERLTEEARLAEAERLEEERQRAAHIQTVDAFFNGTPLSPLYQSPERGHARTKQEFKNNLIQASGLLNKARKDLERANKLYLSAESSITGLSYVPEIQIDSLIDSIDMTTEKISGTAQLMNVPENVVDFENKIKALLANPTQYEVRNYTQSLMFKLSDFDPVLKKINELTFADELDGLLNNLVFESEGFVFYPYISKGETLWQDFTQPTYPVPKGIADSVDNIKDQEARLWYFDPNANGSVGAVRPLIERLAGTSAGFSHDDVYPADLQYKILLCHVLNMVLKKLKTINKTEDATVIPAFLKEEGPLKVLFITRLRIFAMNMIINSTCRVDVNKEKGNSFQHSILKFD